MSADELNSYPITDLLNTERRKELVPKLAFAKGVTTVVTPSGGGKTTLCFCMGLYVSAGEWGQEDVEQRPLLWILGEDQDGLRAIFEAWTQQNPDLTPDARFIDQMVDFANPAQVKWLIKHIHDHFERPPLIVADALSDIFSISGLDEDKSKDVAKVYKGIWNVVNETSALVIVLHHSGWDEKRERGSSTIRQKSDIVVKIVSFDPETGTVRLEHLKRRSGAGPKLSEFCLEAKLVALDNYPELIPIVTGPKEDKVPTTHTADADERNGRKLIQVTATHFPQGATWTQLRDKSEMKPSTYKRALACALRKAWLTKDDNHYNLNSAESQAKDPNSDLGPALGPRVHSYRSVDPLDPITARSSEPNWTQIGPLDPNTSCKDMNTTLPNKKPNKINKAENSPPIAPLVESGVHYDELEAFAVALDQLAGRPSRNAR